MAMWDIYRREAPVLAIKSSVGRLKEAVEALDKPVYIGEMRYISWQEAPWDNNSLAMCMRKKLAYQHEAEVRAIIWDLGWGLQGNMFLELPIDPAQVITEVFVGPREKGWIYQLVDRVITRYGLRIKVTPSDLLVPRTSEL